jgi:hypothetical protein
MMSVPFSGLGQALEKRVPHRQRARGLCDLKKMTRVSRAMGSPRRFSMLKETGSHSPPSGAFIGAGWMDKEALA